MIPISNIENDSQVTINSNRNNLDAPQNITNLVKDTRKLTLLIIAVQVMYSNHRNANRTAKDFMPRHQNTFYKYYTYVFINQTQRSFFTKKISSTSCHLFLPRTLSSRDFLTIAHSLMILFRYFQNQYLAQFERQFKEKFQRISTKHFVRISHTSFTLSELVILETIISKLSVESRKELLHSCFWTPLIVVLIVCQVYRSIRFNLKR